MPGDNRRCAAAAATPARHRLVPDFQEALTNVTRHARATTVEARLRNGEGQVRLEVQDNGRGIAPADQANPGALGLLGMRERAFALGGEVVIRGQPGRGTTVIVTIPLAPP